MTYAKARHIHGITIILHEKVTRGTDPFGREIEEEIEREVDNVLVGLPTADDIIHNQELYGKKAVYILGIPKGCPFEWEDKCVSFFGKKWRTFGPEIQGIEDLVPLEWNKKIMVERYG